MAKGISHRTWHLWRADYDSDDAFTQAVQSELALSQHISDRLGVALVSSPIRQTLDRADGTPLEWFSDGWVFQTASVPTARGPAPAQEPALDDLDEGPYDGERGDVLVERAGWSE